MVLFCAASATITEAPSAAGTSAAGLPASTGASALSAPLRKTEMSRPSTAAGSSPTLLSTEKRPPMPGSCSSIVTLGPSSARRPFVLPGFSTSEIPRNSSLMRPSSPPRLTASSAAAVCIKVSPVPPDFEIATKRVVASGSFPSSVPNVTGSRLSMKCMRGGTRNASAPRTPTSASCASVCPPRLEPPVPSTTTSLAPAASRAPKLLISPRSSIFFGKRSNGSVAPACASRNQPSAASLARNASSSAALLTPLAPIFSARAFSMLWRKVIAVDDCEALGKVSSAPQLVRLVQSLRAPDHGHEQAVIEQAPRHAPGVGERHRVDHRAAPLRVIDAELVELVLHELAGDLGRGIEGDRISALEIGLGLVELLLRRAFLGKPLYLLLDQGERFARAVAARRRGAGHHRRMVEPQQAGAYPIGKAARLAHLAVEPRGVRAAAEDVIDHIGGEEIRILACEARAAELDHCLRHVEIDHHAGAEPAHRHVGNGRQRGLRRQAAEHLVDQSTGAFGIDVADDADGQRATREDARHVALEIVGIDLRHGFEGAVVRPPIRVIGKRRRPSLLVGDVVRAAGAAPQAREHLSADALDRRGVEARRGEREAQQVDRIVEIGAERQQRSAEVVAPGREIDMDRALLEAFLERARVEIARALVEHR